MTTFRTIALAGIIAAVVALLAATGSTATVEEPVIVGQGDTDTVPDDDTPREEEGPDGVTDTEENPDVDIITDESTTVEDLIATEGEEAIRAEGLLDEPVGPPTRDEVVQPIHEPEGTETAFDGSTCSNGIYSVTVPDGWVTNVNPTGNGCGAFMTTAQAAERDALITVDGTNALDIERIDEFATGVPISIGRIDHIIGAAPTVMRDRIVQDAARTAGHQIDDDALVDPTSTKADDDALAALEGLEGFNHSVDAETGRATVNATSAIPIGVFEPGDAFILMVIPAETHTIVIETRLTDDPATNDELVAVAQGIAESLDAQR